MLRRKTKKWTDEHRNVMRKLVVEGGWVQKRFFDIGWSDEKKCQGCSKEEGTEKHRLYHCPCWKEIRSQMPEKFRKWEQRARTSENDWKLHRGITTHPLSGSQWIKSHLRVQRWESEKHKKKAGASQPNAFEIMSLMKVLCWKSWAGGVRLDGPWCSWITTRRWDQCTDVRDAGCRTRSSAPPSRELT